MTGTAMVDLLLRSIVLIAAFWALAGAIERAGGSAAMRHVALLFGFVAIALLPILSVAVPALPLPILPAAPQIPAAAAAAPTTGAPAVTASPAFLLELLYCAVAACLLGLLIAGRILLARIWASARPVVSAPHLHLLAILSESFGLRRRISLRMATGPSVPMSWTQV